MKLINGDRIITAQLYNDEYEEFKEEQMSIIDYVNMYTTEGVTTADDVLEQIRAEIEEGLTDYIIGEQDTPTAKKMFKVMDKALEIIDKYTKGE